MKKKFCDKCGTEVDGCTEPFFLEFKIKKIKRHMNFPNTKSKIHLCGNCCGKLNEWLKEGGKNDFTND